VKHASRATGHDEIATLTFNEKCTSPSMCRHAFDAFAHFPLRGFRQSGINIVDCDRYAQSWRNISRCLTSILFLIGPCISRIACATDKRVILMDTLL